MSLLTGPLTILESSIHRSVLADSFEETAVLLDLYVEELEGTLRASPGERSVLHGQAVQFLEWVGQMALVSREETRAKVTHLRTLSGYRVDPTCQSHARADA